MCVRMIERDRVYVWECVCVCLCARVCLHACFVCTKRPNKNVWCVRVVCANLGVCMNVCTSELLLKLLTKADSHVGDKTHRGICNYSVPLAFAAQKSKIEL